MFKRIPRRCSWAAAHVPHETPTGFFDTAFCDGIALPAKASIWDAMKPNELRQLYGLPPWPIHKHMFRLTKVLVTPKGIQLYPNSIGWRCACGDNYAIERTIFNKMVTGKYEVGLGPFDKYPWQ